MRNTSPKTGSSIQLLRVSDTWAAYTAAHAAPTFNSASRPGQGVSRQPSVNSEAKPKNSVRLAKATALYSAP
ncbi:Uncharacterised protein [Bordetella pertussis]|nr:Uncharacterised protein [Bordetella pertussis]